MPKPGYGKAHQSYRERLRPLVEAGLESCRRCGLQIKPGQKWHLDHTDDRRGYLGPSHAFCNERAGGLKGGASKRKPKPSRYPAVEQVGPRAWSRCWYPPDNDPPEALCPDCFASGVAKCRAEESTTEDE